VIGGFKQNPFLRPEVAFVISHLSDKQTRVNLSEILPGRTNSRSREAQRERRIEEDNQELSFSIYE
jgi:hypothetical protein